MSEQPPIFRTERVSRTYPDGQVTALVEATIRIDRGEYVAIMGPSGSGKSTLLNLLGTLDRPTGGEVFFEDRPLSKLKDPDRFRSQQLGFVFQSFYLLPTLSAVENVQIPMFETSLPVAARVSKAAELLETVGMTHRASHLPSRLSVGERQRVAVARALANDPQVLLADEPTGNLDSKTAAGVLDLFDRLHTEQGMTVVVVTHGEEIAGRAGRTIRLRDGHVVEEAVSIAP